MRFELDGVIASAGFASGDRVVVGHWDRTPIGPMTDVMWARPDGERVLLAPDDDAAAFITAIYVFDRVEIVPCRALGSERGMRVRAGPLTVRLEGGAAIRLPLARPAWFTRRVEGPLARTLLGVETWGSSPTGVQEWYRATSFRRVVAGSGQLDGHDLGAIGPPRPDLGVGFSEPPAVASLVGVQPLLEDPSGRLDDVLAALGTP